MEPSRNNLLLSDRVLVGLAWRFWMVRVLSRAVRLDALLPHLNERQRRLLLGVEARLLGHGGIRVVAQVAGVSETTVRRGESELEAGAGPMPVGRVRRIGGGRSRAEERDPGLVPALLGLVEPDERGDPCSPLRWTTKSLRNLAAELGRQGRTVIGDDGRATVEGQRVQPAGHRQDPGRRSAPRPGRPVPLSQRAGQGPSGCRAAGDQRGRGHGSNPLTTGHTPRVRKMLPLLFAALLIAAGVIVTGSLARANVGCSGDIEQKAACHALQQVGNICAWAGAQQNDCSLFAHKAYERAGVAGTRHRKRAAGTRNNAYPPPFFDSPRG